MFSSTKKISIALISLLFLFSCSENNKGKQDSTKENKLDDKSLLSTNETAEKVKTIFYNIPSPVEMAELTQRANLSYNPDIVNSLDKIDQYTSTKIMALNLGVYGADLSYTRLYDQIQESINYLSGIRKLSQDLGVPQDNSSNALARLEKNINNRDSLLYIITDIYTNVDFYLKENERSETAALIITGGWIEALYIATNIIDENNPNPEILERIAEQKFSLENLILLLDSQFDTMGSLQNIYDILQELMDAFNKVEHVHTPGEIITDEENKITSIKSKTEIYINFEQIKEIKAINDKLRNLIIS